jgi:hypothetical protein
MTTDYRQSLALGGTDARLIAKDFEAWWFRRQLVERGELPPWMQDEPSEAQSFGTAVHMALLEPLKFAARCVPMPYVESFALKAGKTIKEEHLAKAREVSEGFILRAEHKWAIEHIERNANKAMQEAFGYTPPARGLVEVPFFASLNGVECKGQPDWLLDGLVVDIKTTRDMARTRQTFADERYGIQLAHYARLSNGTGAAIVWVENVAPFRCEVQILDPEEFVMAMNAHAMALERYKDASSNPDF